jgi:hypothetical protein
MWLNMGRHYEKKYTRETTVHTEVETAHFCPLRDIDIFPDIVVIN